MRDLFIDLVEKLVEPALAARWTPPHLKSFMNALKKSGHKIDFIKK